jgi:ABC-2 type transport system permease protein
MTAGAITLRQVLFFNKTFWRNPASAFFTFAFPLMFLVIFNAIFGQSQFFVPCIAAFSIVSACFTNVAMSMTIARDEGILKRVRGTPLPGWMYLLAKVIHSSLIALLLVVVVAAFGALFYDVALPSETMPAFLLSVVVGAAAYCALGLAITGSIPNGEAAPAVVNALVIPLSFISDIFAPYEDVPAWLQAVAEFFPLKHYADMMNASFNPPPGSSGFEWADIAVVAAWGAFGLLVSMRFFKWETPR